MSKTLDNGVYHSTGGTLAKTINKTLFAEEFIVQKNQPEEVILTGKLAKIDRPENLRYAVSSVANIYSGTAVDPSVYAPSRKGVSILAQLTTVGSVTDTVDATYRVDLPCSVHVVFKVPAHEMIDGATLKVLLDQLYMSLTQGDGTDSMTARLDSLLRGSLSPTTL